MCKSKFESIAKQSVRGYLNLSDIVWGMGIEMQNKKETRDGVEVRLEEFQIPCDGCGLAVNPYRELIVKKDDKIFCIWCWDNNCCGITGNRDK